MKKIILLFILLVAGYAGIAQEKCGYDSLLQLQRSPDPVYFDNKLEQINNVLTKYITNDGTRATIPISTTAQYVIPVVVHIVRDPGDPVPVISYAQIEGQIDALNAAYAKNYPAYNGHANGTYSNNTRIQFCLARTVMGPTGWTNSAEPGVMRYSSATLAANQMTVAGTNSLLNLTHPGTTAGTYTYFPFARYLNIWVVKSIDGLCSGTQGYSVLPIGASSGMSGFLIDGVVIRGDAFGDNSTGHSYTLQPHTLYGASCPSASAQRNEGKVLVHEVGHYLNLFHTFQPDIFTAATCAGSTTATCNTQGDFICDTPPNNLSSFSTFNCTGTRNTCAETYAPYLPNYGVGTLNPNDQTENFMYYSFDPCWNTFTKDQSDRMEAFLVNFRPELFTVQNQVATGILGATGCLPPQVLSEILYTTGNPNNAICTAGNVNFSTFGSPVNTATTYNWSFPGASPSTSTAANPVVTYATPGTYTVTLTTSDGTTNSTSSSTVLVTSCAAITDLDNANWYFGQYGSVSFNTGLPVANNSSRLPVTLFNTEACATQNDPATGATIFYTDGIDIWNGLHQQFNTSPLGGFISSGWNPVLSAPDNINSASQVLSVPFPGHPNMYYVIIPRSIEGGNTGLRFAVIDMNLFTAGVQGAVTLQGVLPSHTTNTAGTYGECVTAIPHCNGRDYWIITHGVSPNHRFYVHLLSSMGLTNGTLTATTPDAYGPFSAGIGGSQSTLKVSPDGTRLAISHYANTSLLEYQFNSSTGAISTQTLYTTGAGDRFQSCSYSPNSLYLYGASYNLGRIIQFTLSTGAWNTVTNTIAYLDGMQLGPDNKLYVARQNTDLGCIPFPDVAATATFTTGAVGFGSISGSLPKLQLPNMVDAVQPASSNPSFTIIMTNCSTAVFTVSPCWQNYTASWNFGDATPSVSGTSVTHTFGATNTYNVTLTLTAPLLTTPYVVAQPVSIINGSPAITGSSSVCIGGGPYSYSVPFTSGATYAWTVTSGGTITGPATGPAINVNWTSGTAGTVSVTINYSGCVYNATMNVTVNAPPTVGVTASPAFVCPAGAPVTLTASGASTYNWTYNSTTATGNPITDNPTATTTYTVIGTNASGCQASATISVTVTPTCGCSGCTAILPTSGSTPLNQVYCVNSSQTLSGSLTITSCEVKMSPGVSITVPSGMTLTIKGSHLYACGDMWQGIVVQPGGSVVVQNFILVAPPYININKSSFIEDAVIAIDIQSTPSTASNPLVVMNATFNRNFKSIRIANHSIAAGPVYPITIIGSVFTSRYITFTPGSISWPHTNSVMAMTTVTNPLQTPYISDASYPDNNPVQSYLKAPYLGQKPYVGIELQNVGTSVPPTSITPTYYDIQIGTTGATNYNVFDNLATGIYGVSTNLISVNNIFQRTAPQQGEGYGINVQSPEQLHNRLQVIPASGSDFVNRFFDCGKAINSLGYFENIITNCHVRSTHPTTAPTASPAYFRGKNGIFVSSHRFKTVNISIDSVYNVEHAISFTGTIGSYSTGGAPITGQYSGQVDINTNTIAPTLPSYAATSYYVSQAISATNTSLTTGTTLVNGSIRINGNRLSNVYKGISANNWRGKDLLTNDNVITLLANAFLPANQLQYGILHGKNTSLTTPYGNAVTGNIVTGPGISTNLNFYSVTVNTCNGTLVKCNTTSKTTKGIVFSHTNSPTSFNHNTMSDHQYGYALDSTGWIGIQGSTSTPSDNRWSGTWTGGNVKTATLNNGSASTAVGSALYVRGTTASIYNPDGSTYSPSGAANEYSMLNGTVITVASPPVYVLCPAPPHLAPIDDNRMPIKYAERIAPGEAEDAGEKMVGKIYPNPNNGVMQMDYTLTGEQAGTLVIYDLTGRKQSSYELVSGTNTLQVDESKLANGIYVYHVIVNNELIISDKIVIVK